LLMAPQDTPSPAHGLIIATQLDDAPRERCSNSGLVRGRAFGVPEDAPERGGQSTCFAVFNNLESHAETAI
jgi:hypothetical protein